ncbi:PepSY-associated TM helix domain-containing protein [Actinomadura sp. 9N407]|uniref:PepSY-associated TM helix domain-containing protein n=1 Tax=Actinomadura sp. 9N407 TaxID=3375154 RepID=UPI00378F7B3C
MSTIADQPSEKTVPAPDGRRSGRGPWPLITRLHFYAGVLVAPFLILALLTGLAYAFTPQLDRLVYGDELRVERVAGTPRPLAEQVRAARTAHPEGSVSSVISPATAEDTTRIVLSVPELKPKQRTVYVDPYSGEVTGALTTDSGSTPVTTWLSELHRSLHLGEAGSLYSELAASWLWVIVLGGVVMWFGRRRHYRGTARAHRALWHDRSARGVRRTRGRHAALGVWLAAGLLLLSATGLTWTNHAGARFDKLQAGVRSTPPELDTGVPSSGAHHHGTGGSAGDPATHIDHVLAAARTAGLNGPVELGPPEKPGTAWTVTQVDDVWPVRKDKVAVDAAAMKVTDRVGWSEHPPMAKLSSLGIQLHMGKLFGIANQLALAFLALGLLTVLLWGYRMWWQRRPTRDSSRAIAGRPPARGALRQLPVPALLFLIVVVAAIGWSLPVLGISLLAFLALDTLTGMARSATRRT